MIGKQYKIPPRAKITDLGVTQKGAENEGEQAVIAIRTNLANSQTQSHDTLGTMMSLSLSGPGMHHTGTNDM